MTLKPCPREEERERESIRRESDDEKISALEV
jgi:hypothetical protein